MVGIPRVARIVIGGQPQQLCDLLNTFFSHTEPGRKRAWTLIPSLSLNANGHQTPPRGTLPAEFPNHHNHS